MALKPSLLMRRTMMSLSGSSRHGRALQHSLWRFGVETGGTCVIEKNTANQVDTPYNIWLLSLYCIRIVQSMKNTVDVTM